MAESALHHALKAHYAGDAGEIEVNVDGCIIDVVRDGHLIEIQTGSFTALKPKLARLLDDYPVRVVFPVPHVRWLVDMDADGLRVLRRRKSPKRGRVEDVFRQLVRIVEYIPHRNFSLDVLLVQDEEVRRDDGQGSWRRKHKSIFDRRLIDVVGRRTLDSVTDYTALLPPDLPDPFTVAEMAAALKLAKPLAGKMAYTLREIGAVTVAGKRGRAFEYCRP